MKSNLNHFSKRLLSLILAVIMTVTLLPLSAISSFAFKTSESQTVDSDYGSAYIGYDGGKYYVNDNNYCLRYRSDGSTYIQEGQVGSVRAKLMIIENGESMQALCIEYGVDIARGSDTYVSQNAENSAYFNMLPMTVKRGIMLTTVYGWHPGKSLPISGINEDDYSLATQIIIWEYQQGIRTNPSTRVANGALTADKFYSEIQGRPAELAYNWILSQMAKHATVPSFASSNRDNAPTHTLKYDTATKKYSLTLTDINNTNIDISATSGSGITVTRSGNKYTFTSNSMIITASLMEYKKNISLYEDKLLVWGNVGNQAMITGVSDPIRFYANFNTETYGTAKITKSSEDGKISGVKFKITGNGVDEIVTTNAQGSIEKQLLPGTYTITEEVDNRYEPQNSQTVAVISGQTATVTFSNTLKRGDLIVSKTSEDGFVKGIKFHLYGTSLSGEKVDLYAVTDENGKAYFKDVLISGDTPYTLEEVETSTRYVVPEAQNTTIEWNKVTEKTFQNILKKWRTEVCKADSEGNVQGDGTLEGAVYGVYKGDELIDSYITDKNGYFVTDYYPCGNDWTIREITPSEGYLLDTTIHKIPSNEGSYTIENNSIKLNVYENVIKGKISVIKHNDDGSTQIETPEEGAEFEVFLKSAGAYKNAKETERDILVCDKHGYAETKDLPYGIYTVKQTKGWDGREFMSEFDVFIKEDGETYRYLINNSVFKALVEIQKRDAESMQLIPVAGVGFKVRNTDTGEFITQHVNYPIPMDIEIYYTDSTGKLILPDTLPLGNYEIIEQKTCYGYVLDPTPVPFVVDGTKTVVIVEKYNYPQKGTITITKNGEVFSSVTEKDEIYQPVYEVRELEGAVFEVRAAEDIITSDGIVRYIKGTVVDTITTDKDGTATTDPLYLGKYEVYEIIAPYGMVLNPEPISVELIYSDEKTKVTSVSTSVANKRQTIKVLLKKDLECDDAFGIYGELRNVKFALYADEDIVAADGTFIPKDGLIEVSVCNENGSAEFNTDLPVDAKVYVKEYTTDEGYIISNEIYPVTFEYAGQDVPVLEFFINNGNTLINEMTRGSIFGKKVDEDGFNIAGATFGLFREDETEYSLETAILVSTSNEIGVFCFENVPYGSWIVRELKPAPAFVPNDTLYPVTISENDQIIELTVENVFIVGSVQTTKVDKDYPENKLSGAVFEIYVDIDGNKAYNGDIDKLVGEMSETGKGIYEMTNLRYNRYFLYEKTAPEGFVKDDGYYYFEITENNRSVVVENEAGKGFTNTAKVGSLKIVKTSSDNKVEGFSFRVTGPCGYNEVFATDEKGEILIDNIRIGEYLVSEMLDDVSMGYVLPDDKQTVVQEGAVTTVEMYNELIIHSIAPQTGDNSNLSFWSILALISGGSIGIIVFQTKRKRKIQ